MSVIKTSRHRIICLMTIGCAFAFGILSGCGAKKSESEKTSKTSKTADAPESSQTGDPDTDVKAAIDGAIAAVENKDYKTLINKYAPARVYERLQQTPNGVDKAVSQMKRDTRGENEILAKLKGAKTVSPIWNADKTVAKFEFTVSAGKTIQGGGGPLHSQTTDPQTAAGYGDDLSKALQKATADLEAGKLQNYLASMLPASELAILNLADVEKRLKDSPALKQSIQDFKTMQQQKPELQGNGSVAVWKLPMPGAKTKGPGSRIVKLQKVGKHWRLFDNTTAMKTASAQFSRTIPAETGQLTMEYVKGEWRIADDRGGRPGRRRDGPPRAKVSEPKIPEAKAPKN